ncbi:putative cupin superfamily protein [Vogesella perlucida]|jgi:uncharacterized cupin superfamily protein|nr:putative cupin superfamily protein [Vogesella perlucida]
MGIVRVVAQGAAQEDRPNPQRLVEGNPLRHTWSAYETSNEQCAAGIWACEPGAWRIAFAADKHEFFAIISGRVRLTDEHGHAETFGPGEAAVIPAGFRGEFRVLEAVRKYYVIVSGIAP